MATDNISAEPSREPLRPRLTVRDRFLSWVVTGPVGRGLAFFLDLGALAWRQLRRRDPDPGRR
jgi:hypothetical protein